MYSPQFPNTSFPSSTKPCQWVKTTPTKLLHFCKLLIIKIIEEYPLKGQEGERVTFNSDFSQEGNQVDLGIG
jgi:hypothetical protein